LFWKDAPIKKGLLRLSTVFADTMSLTQYRLVSDEKREIFLFKEDLVLEQSGIVVLLLLLFYSSDLIAIGN
jgi:hypothetical protein